MCSCLAQVIHCVAAHVEEGQFRPYDLVVVDEKEGRMGKNADPGTFGKCAFVNLIGLTLDDVSTAVSISNWCGTRKRACQMAAKNMLIIYIYRCYYHRNRTPSFQCNADPL